ncbi:hypothetical protein KW805_03870 [Candidatus Pacearchaeota archaeon]|nr:hypothetical protein [Candidatus Pacearchaeota archaeon]
MNKRAFFGTIIWAVILLLIVTGTLFYIKYKDTKPDALVKKVSKGSNITTTPSGIVIEEHLASDINTSLEYQNISQ